VTELVSVRRLNFGCGYDKREGYLNVDMDPACEPDVLLVDNDLSVLPRDSFDEILAMDVLEHIPRLATPSVLTDWSDLLVDGGQLRIQTSSIDGVAAQIAKDPTFQGQYSWTHCLFGSQAHPGDFHLTGFTETTLKVHLLAAGFNVDRMWISGLWLLNAEGTKAMSWARLAVDLHDVPDDDYVREVYRAILYREPEGHESLYFGGELASGRIDRRGIARRLMSSPERLLVTAERHGFARKPKSPFANRVRPFIPGPLVPPLRSVHRSLRAVRSQGRRALGARNREQLTT
jgi:predicted SAM-dependent methyltransferase